jgi:2-hydroxy-6-oxonona-2,4-dienedioate hydrolase
MTSATIAHPPTDVRTARYLDAERALWAHYGLDPRERILELETPPCRLRVLEVGSGDPLLLVHGTVGPGSWVSLAAELPGFRSIVLDRPGWGLSSPIDYPGRDYGRFVGNLLVATLDALGLERAHVAGGSIGDVWALRLAALHPERVDRVLLLGGGPIVPEAGVPGVIRLIVSPAGAVMTRVMTSPASVQTMLRRSGHGGSLDAGVIPEVFVEWRAAAARETAAMRHERAMARRLVDGKSYRAGLTFDDDELAGIAAPTLMVYGAADGVGTVDLWRRVTGRMPEAELHVVEGAGHMPWFDDPEGVGERIERFLTAAAR